MVRLSTHLIGFNPPRSRHSGQGTMKFYFGEDTPTSRYSEQRLKYLLGMADAYMLA